MAEKIDIIQQIREDFDKASHDRQAMEQQAYINYCAFLGYPVWFNETTKTLSVDATLLSDGRSKAHFNLIAPAVRIVVSKVASELPVPVILPASTAPEDIVTARVAEKFARWVWLDNKMSGKQIQKVWRWAIIEQVAFIGIYYNPKTGKVELEPISMWEIYPERGKDSIKSCDYVDRVFKRKKSYIEKRYDVKLPTKINPTQSDMTITNYHSQLLGKMYSTPNIKGSGPPEDIEAYTLVERWYKDRVVRGVIDSEEDILLRDEPNTYREIPFVQFDYEPIPGRWYGKSPIEDCLTPQRLFSYYHASRIDMIKLASNPPLLDPIGGELGERTTVKPGERIPYDPSLGEPKYLQPPIEPSYVDNEIGAMQEQIMNIFGVFQASQGQAPYAGASGRALSRMYQFDETKFGPIMAAAHESYADVYQQVLNRAKLIPDDFIFRSLTELGKTEIGVFKRSDAEKSFDVVKTTGSMLAADKASAKEFVLKAMGVPAIVEEIGVKRLIRMYDLAMPDQPLDQDSNEQNLIMVENAMLENGEEVLVETCHNHPMHVPEHNQLRLSPTWMTRDPKTKATILAHIESHIATQEALDQGQMQRDRVMNMFQQPPVMPGQPGGQPGSPAGPVGHPPDLTKPNREVAEPPMEEM